MFESPTSFAVSPNAGMLVAAVAQSWKDAWTWIYMLGIGSFYLLVLAVIPLGFRDLVRLFAHLSQCREDHLDNRKNTEAQDHAAD